MENNKRYEMLEYLRKKLKNHEKRAIQRYAQYDMKFFDHDIGFVIPRHIKNKYKATLGWTTKAVDALADRLVFREFKDNIFEINEIFRLNNPDILFDSAILNALISSCSFIYISKDDEDFVRLQVIESLNATGIIDPITGLLKNGYAVLDRDKNNNPVVEALFEPNVTTIIRTDEQGKEYVEDIQHEVSYPLLVPILHRPDAVRPFGRSRITKSVEYWQRYAKRTLERADVTAEFYSFPQKYVTGLSQNAEIMDSWRATISTMLSFEKDEDGENPSLGQFTTPSMSPFTEQLRTAASGFAGETGLTLDDLGFVSDNPSSAEAIKASHETLRVMAEKAQRSIGSGLLNVGFLASCLRDNFDYRRDQFTEIELKWEPIFRPDASTISLIGDGTIKVNQAIPGYINNEVMRDLTGIKGADE